MLFDPSHFLQRLIDPFNPESRFYWPLVIGVVVGIIANTLWYYWRTIERPSPGELALRPWAYWINVIFLTWALVMLLAKVPFYWYVVSLTLNVALLVYMYVFWLPPRDAAWSREVRRQKYMPRPGRRRR